MKVMLVDDERLALQLLAYSCEKVKDVQLVGSFDDPRMALAYAKQNEVDCALLDIEMPEINGIELAHELHKLRPETAIVFVTGYDQYAFEAFGAKAIGYLLKPFEQEDLEEALHHAQILSERKSTLASVHTFGRFDVFVQNELVAFKSAKAKELLALCVEHEGGVVSMEEAIDKLWEDKPYDEKVKNLYRKAVVSLRATLKEHGIEMMFVSARGSCYVNKKMCKCDYFDLLEGGANAYHGEFMFEYGWAGETNAYLTQFCLSGQEASSAQRGV